MTTRLDQVDNLIEARQAEADLGFTARILALCHEFWWDPKRPGQTSLWENRIELGEKFFNEIIRNPVPLNMNVLKALRRSSLGLDLYLWLNYRTFSLKHPIRLSWKRLYRQLGAGPDKANDKLVVNDFRKKCLRELTKISVAAPELHCSTARGALIIAPSQVSIGRCKEANNAL
jgi:hypothetical protein